MELLRALGLSPPGWISHVQQHTPSLTFRKAACLACCLGLSVQRLPGCPAQPPWSSGVFWVGGISLRVIMIPPLCIHVVLLSM